MSGLKLLYYPSAKKPWKNYVMDGYTAHWIRIEKNVTRKSLRVKLFKIFTSADYLFCWILNLARTVPIWKGQYKRNLKCLVMQRWHFQIHNGILETIIWFIIEIYCRLSKCLILISPIFFPAVEMLKPVFQKITIEN